MQVFIKKNYNNNNSEIVNNRSKDIPCFSIGIVENKRIKCYNDIVRL